MGGGREECLISGGFLFSSLSKVQLSNVLASTQRRYRILLSPMNPLVDLPGVWRKPTEDVLGLFYARFYSIKRFYLANMSLVTFISLILESIFQLKSYFLKNSFARLNPQEPFPELLAFTFLRKQLDLWNFSRTQALRTGATSGFAHHCIPRAWCRVLWVTGTEKDRDPMGKWWQKPLFPKGTCWVQQIPTLILITWPGDRNRNCLTHGEL